MSLIISQSSPESEERIADRLASSQRPIPMSPILPPTLSSIAPAQPEELANLPILHVTRTSRGKSRRPGNNGQSTIPDPVSQFSNSTINVPLVGSNIHGQIQCPCCPSLLLKEGLVKHINKKHAGLVTEQDVAILGMTIHQCGTVTTIAGAAKHANRCLTNVTPSTIAQIPSYNGPTTIRVDPLRSVPVANLQLIENSEQTMDAVLPQPMQLVAATVLAEYSRDIVGLDLYVSLAKLPPPVFTRYHKSVRDEFYACVQSACSAYLTSPIEERLLHILCLPKLGLDTAVHVARARLRQLSRGQVSVRQMFQSIHQQHQRRPLYNNNNDPNILSEQEHRQVEKSICSGNFRKAAAVIRGEFSVAAVSAEVVTEMRNKHPTGSVSPFGNYVGVAPPPLSNDTQSVLDHLIAKLDLQSSAGPSGWSPALIQFCYGKPEQDTPFRQFLFYLAKQIYLGTAPGKQMLCGARLTALKQSPTKLRPIACGECFYRIIMRFILKVAKYDNALLPVQLGVGSPGGVSPIVELFQYQYEQQLDQLHDQYAYSLDFSNAFNNVSRGVIARAVRELAPALYRMVKWAYNDRTPLIMSGSDDLVVISSSQGVRQGDPLGPLLFSIAIRSKVRELQLLTPDAASTTVAGYLDDLVIISPRNDLMPAIHQVFAPDPGSATPTDGFILNRSKTRIDNFRDVVTSETGLNVLGTTIGSVIARRTFIRGKIEIMQHQMNRLRQLPFQHMLLLLRLCIAPELTHLLRTMDLSDLDDELNELDQLVYNLVRYLRLAPDQQLNGNPDRDRIANRVTTLPISLGGLGLFSYAELRPLARAACREEASFYLHQMGIPVSFIRDGPSEERPRSQKMRTTEYFKLAKELFLGSLSSDQQLAFVDNCSSMGSSWLHVAPRANGHRQLRNKEIATTLSVKFLLPDAADRAICSRCTLQNKPLHSECCTQQRFPAKTRHDIIRDKLYGEIRKFRWSGTEPAVAINPSTRRADLSIGSAADGLALDPLFGFVDIKVKCVLAADTAAARIALVREVDETFEHYNYSVLNAALTVEHDTCVQSYSNLALRQPVVPLVISSGGSLHATAKAFFKAMFPDVMTRKEVFKDISIALVRARAQVYNLSF